MADEFHPLTPQQDAAVRALLREARHDAPCPPDVAARLDAVLESLEAAGNPGAGRGGGQIRPDGVFVDPDPTTFGTVSGPPAQPPPPPWHNDTAPTAPQPRGQQPGYPPTAPGFPGPTGAAPSAVPVLDLAARRRRRIGIGLLAAAATVVAAVGIGQVLGGDDPQTNAVDEPTQATQTDPPNDSEQNEPSEAPGSTEGAVPTQAPMPTVSALTFRSDVRAAWPQLQGLDRATIEQQLTGCSVPDGTDLVFPVWNDATSTQAALAADRIGDDRFRVTLYDCLDGTDLRSAVMDLSE